MLARAAGKKNTNIYIFLQLIIYYLSSPLFKYLVNNKYLYFDTGTEIIKQVDKESLDNRNIQRE